MSPAYHIDPQYAEGQLAQFCMCYIAARLNQAQGFGGEGSLFHITHGSKVDLDFKEISGNVGHHAANSPSLESHSLLEYVLSHTFNHLAQVNPENKTVLKALIALEVDVRRNPLEWERMCEERNSTFAWPTSKDDFLFYILISFAPEQLLRSFLGRSLVKPRVGTNPLVYAAQLDRVEHAGTLLSRGATLNCSGLWRSRQAIPLEVAVHCGSSAVANLFLTQGSSIPRRLFVDITKTGYLNGSAGVCIVARLLQTDDFAEWAVDVQDEFPFLRFLGPLDDEWTCYEEHRPNDEDIVTIIRRLVQVGCELFAHGSTGQKLFHRATAVGHISTLRYMVSLDIPLPPDILLHVSRSANTSLTIMRFLLDNGGDPHAATSEGETVLRVALHNKISEDECLERVKILVNAGCDPSAYSLYDHAPLHYAVACGFISVVQCLLSLGALLPPDILLSVSVSKKHPSRKVSTVIRHLIHMGADVHVTAANGDTTLHVILDYSISDYQDAEEDPLECTKILIEAGCSPSISNSAGDTPMDIAVQNAHVSVVEYFLALNVPLPPDALLKASTGEKSPDTLQMIKLLLEKGANVNVVSADGDNALHLAIRFYPRKHAKSTEITLSEARKYTESTVKMLVEAGCDPGAPNIAGETPSHVAARCKERSILAYFLSRGVPLPRDILLIPTSLELYTLFLEQRADPLVVARNGDTVLHGIIDKFYPERDALKLTKVLIRAGCNPSVPNSAGETPLQIAVRRGCVPIIEYLLPVSVSLPSDILLTALHHPPSLPHSDKRVRTIRFLIEKGAVRNVVTKNGDGALHLALSSHFVKEDDASKAAQILIGAGCDPRAQNVAGRTALHAAAIGGYISIMEYLISLGVPFNHNILLDQATTIWQKNKSTVMRFLISKGADIHAVTANGDTPLYLTLACSYEPTRLETAQILVDSGCDPSRPNLAGETPLHVAASSGFPPLVKYLRSRNVPLPSDILLSAAAAVGRAYRHFQAPRIIPMFQLLVREGASVTVIAPNGDTLLHIAVRRRSNSPRKYATPWNLIALLLNAGCDPFVCNADAQTSLDLAEERGHLFYNNFVRLVNSYRGSDLNRLGRHLQMSSSKRHWAEEMDRDTVGRLTKRSRLDDIGDEDEIAEVDEQLMA